MQQFSLSFQINFYNNTFAKHKIFSLNLFKFVNFQFNENMRITNSERRDWKENTFQLISTYMFVELVSKRNKTDIPQMNELGKNFYKL